MVDFASLYKRPAGEARRPPTMPAGNWPCLISKRENVISGQKKTPGYKYYVSLQDYPEDMSESWTETDEHGAVHEYSKEDIRLGGQRDYTFWFWPSAEGSDEIAEAAIWGFDEFLRQLGIDPKGRSYEELADEPVGHQAL